MKMKVFKKLISATAVLLLLNFMTALIFVYATDTAEPSGSADVSTGDVAVAPADDDDKQITVVEDAEGNLKYTYRVMNDIELRGNKGESKWFFDVDKELEVKDFKFNLYCRLSPMIIKEISYITIYMNGIPVHSMSLKDDNNELVKNWVINIPANRINTGYNELTLRTYTLITPEPCPSDEHITNWLIVDANTNYVITYAKKPLFNQISDFPRPLVGRYADDAPGIGVVIPDSYTNEELSAALTLIAHMKAYQPGYQVKTTLVTSSDQSIPNFDSIIYIGNYNGMPENLKSLVDNGSSIDTNNANIYRVSSGDYRKPLFFIISDNGGSLMNAVKALNNSQIREQMVFNYYSLAPGFDTKMKGKENKDYIYLKDLGLNGIEVEGIKRQVTTIGIRIPFNEVLANDSSIDLNIRYSDNLDYEKSMVSVSINGIPIGSERLEFEKKDLHKIKVFIPEECRSYSYYDIRVEFELIPSGIITCEKYLASTPWAYIQEDTCFYMPRQERRIMLFDNLPYPFSRNDDLDETTIVLPDNPERHDLVIAGNIAELLGISVKKNEGIIKVVKGSMFGESYYSDNLIIFGTPNENSTIKAVNNNLWFKYDDGFTRVLSNEKMELLPETSKTAAFFEIKNSPYNEKKGMLTITSLDEKSLQDSVVYFRDDKRWLLTGDAAVISKDGELVTLRFQKEEERPIVDRFDFVNKDTWYYVIFAGTTLLLILLALILYLYKNKKSTRSDRGYRGVRGKTNRRQ